MRDAYIFSWYTPANLGQILSSFLYVSNAFDPFNISGIPEILLEMATSKNFVRNLIVIVLSRGIPRDFACYMGQGSFRIYTIILPAGSGYFEQTQYCFLRKTTVE